MARRSEGLLPDDSSYSLPPGSGGKIRLQQDLVWIKVTRPQIVARQCLREASQKEGGVPCDEGNSLLAHPAWVPGSAPWTATLLLPCLFSRHSLFLLWRLEIATCPSLAPWPGSGRWGKRYPRVKTELPGALPASPPSLQTHTSLVSIAPITRATGPGIEEGGCCPGPSFSQASSVSPSATSLPDTHSS